MFDFNRYLSEHRELVNATLHALLAEMPANRLVQAMAYSLMAGGKRLRPILCLAGAEAVGGRSDEALDAACALEMVHTYSLIHDDLPAMDDDALRRGKPTCHVAFDEATAILAGDALLTLAFETLARRAALPQDPARRLTLIRIISRSAGCRGMVEGQMRDMASEQKQIAPKELEAMHALKTGALLAAAVEAGAVCGGGTELQRQALKTYGDNIGLAFQVTDDILNIEGDPMVLGKAVGTDRLRRKNTYPELIGMEASKTLRRNLVNNALQALEGFDNRADPLRAVATYVIERKR